MTKDELIEELENLAIRFSKGWHEGIKIDASDIMLFNQIAEALAQPEQEPVAWLDPEWGENICPEVGYEVTMTDDHPRDLCWIPLYAHPPQNTNETDEEIKSKCPRTDSIWSLGWYEGYKACNKNTAQAYLKGFDDGCKTRNGDTTGRWSGK